MRRILSSAFVALGVALIGIPVQAAPATSDTGDMHWFGTATAVAPGTATSTLVRNSSGVSATIHTVGLPGNTADTVWWVVFNHPTACSHPMGGARCGLKDLFVPAVAASVQFAAGHVVDADGTADYGAHLSVGDTSGCASAALPCNGLFDPRTADVHVVVRTHGAPLPGLIDEQISTFNGGCPPNNCKNLQAAAHEAL